MGISDKVAARFSEAAMGEREASEPTTYREWLEAQNYKVTPEQYADHRNFLEVLDPLVKLFERFIHDYAQTGYGIPTTKFSREDAKTLTDAWRLLRSAEIPMALLDVKAPKPILRIR